MGNALVELEAQFPFNLDAAGGSQTIQTGPLFGIGRSLYFCVPRNATLLGYWDTVADRLFKIRTARTCRGRPASLPLFDPPLDPGVLVQATAAGHRCREHRQRPEPARRAGPQRHPLIQKAIELCSDVKAFGAALLAAFEKGDAEQLAQLRQSHELSLQQMTQNVRFLQWKQAQEATQSLLRTRAVTLERFTFYLRALGLTQTDDNSGYVPAQPGRADRRQLCLRLRDAGIQLRPDHHPPAVPDPPTSAGDLPVGPVGRIRHRPALPQHQRGRRTRPAHADRGPEAA